MSSGLLEMYDDDVWCGWPVVTSPSPAVAVRSMSSGGQHWHSTLHTPQSTPQLLHLHHTDSLTRTCILSQHCNRDTFRDLDFVVPPALSYQHSTHTLVPGIQLWSRWDSCNTSCCCCIAQYESKPVNDCYIFRRTPWVIHTVSCCRASDHVSFWRESIRGEYRD